MSIDVEEKDIAFFCIADSFNYVPMAITTLASVRRFHPEAKYFIVGKFKADKKALELISKHKITFQYLDLTNTFNDCKPINSNLGGWPSECFWWAYGYKLFSKLGFKFSCLLDGDIFCVDPVEFGDVLKANTTVAGVEKRNQHVNSGVLFFNHKNLMKIGLFEKIIKLYKTEKSCQHIECMGYCVEKGDQGLLWELERVYKFKINRIANIYNHMLIINHNGYLEKNPDAPFRINQSKMLHFLRKPWGEPLNQLAQDTIYGEGYELWWHFVEGFWPNRLERTMYFGER